MSDPALAPVAWAADVDVIYDLQALSVQGNWRLIASDESEAVVRDKMKKYQEWNKDRTPETGWADFRIVRVTTTSEVLPNMNQSNTQQPMTNKTACRAKTAESEGQNGA